MGVRILPLPKQLSSCLETADAEDRVNAPTASAQTATAMTAPRSKDTLTLNRPPAQSLKPPISMDYAASRTPKEDEGEVGIDKTAASPSKNCIQQFDCCNLINTFCIQKQCYIRHNV